MSLRSNVFVLGFAVILALQGCVSAPPSPIGTKTPGARSPATPTDTRQRLDALFENYFEDNLRANLLPATYIGDHRYDDQLPNSIRSKFDLRNFHREVPSDGAVPMDVLEAKVDRWIAARR